MIFVKWETELIVVLITILDRINFHPVDLFNANFLQSSTALGNFVGLIFTKGLCFTNFTKKYLPLDNKVKWSRKILITCIMNDHRLALV